MSKIHASIASTRTWLARQGKRIFGGSGQPGQTKVAKSPATVHNFGPQLTVRLIRKQLREQCGQRESK